MKLIKLNEQKIQDKLEAVVVCVDYSDLLEIFFRENSHIFDHIVIVTTEKDKKTQKVCKKYNCTTVLTNAFYEDEGAIFNKGKAINIGYENLKYKQWSSSNNHRCLQGLIAKAVVLKFTPTLKFIVDDSIVRGNRVLQILDELEKTSPSENGPAK